MKLLLATSIALASLYCVQGQTGDLAPISGVQCVHANYYFPDPDNLCFVWRCVYPGEPPIKEKCPKGVRVPSWWEGGSLAMCNIVNIVKHGGDPVCLRCAANDIRPDDSCAATPNPCAPECTCIDEEHTHRCDCPVILGVTGGDSVAPPRDHCLNNPCENGASCQNQWDGFFCFCPNGFTGHRCEIPICDWHPCLNGGTCVVDEIGYHCECTDCFTGSCCNATVPGCSDRPGIVCGPCQEGPNCEYKKNTCGCNGERCGDAGTCVDTPNGPKCEDCPKCFTGAGCKIAVDSCECNNNCPSNARCEDLIDVSSHECICNDCWTGANCDVRKSTCACDNPCAAGSTCTDVSGSATCQCGSCQSGPYCQNSVVSCACANPCGANQVCIDTTSGPTCDCSDSCFTGPTCSERVQSCTCNNPCQNGGQCQDTASGPVCSCESCHSGPYCQSDVTSCACANPCAASQVCQQSAASGALSCGCSDSCFTGPSCSERVQSCACNNPCQNGGQCQDTASGPVCSCDSCHEGTYCERDIVSCACANPCASGETCSDVSPGVTSCGCSDPCKTGPGCAETINSCACANPCTAAQVCDKVANELVCSCSDPCREGQYCDQVKNTCGCNNPCQNGGLCSLNGGQLMCDSCDSCWTGPTCEEQVVSCDCNSPCGAGEVCNMQNGAPVCGCPPCMTGDFCDIPVDSCACNNPCNNPDKCEDINGSAQCVCDCTGNEECRNDPITNQPVCKCPLCFYNQPGYEGCMSPVQNLCVCNNPCTADQQVCVDGPAGSTPICKIGNPSSGNAFTVVFEENDSERSFREIPLELYLTPSLPDSGTRKVNIRSAGLAADHHCYFNVNKTIPENAVLRFPVERCMMHNKTGLENLAIRMTELNNDTMLVYGINKDRWTADGFLATPDFQAGSSFQTVSYAPAHISTQFAIVALFDDTDVEITLADDNDLPAPYNTRGSVYRFTMQAFETFQVQARCPNAPKSKRRQCEKDLSGSLITANNKIHVFSGNVRAFVKAGEGLSRDHLVEEMVPTDRWGTEFGMISVPGRAVGDLLNIMALNGQATNVDIYFNGQKQTYSLPVNGRLNKHVEVPSNSLIFIKSDKPLSVTQLTKSKDTYLFRNESVHDPVTITIPPTSQFTNNFFISTPLFSGGENFELKPYQENLALLVARRGEENTITLDGAPLTSFVMPWGDLPMPAGGSDALVGAVISIPHGTRLIRNREGANFQCIIYGFDDRESYGFPAAMNQKVV